MGGLQGGEQFAPGPGGIPVEERPEFPGHRAERIRTPPASRRWSVARKRAVVLRLIAGEPVELVSREIGVPVFKLERWRERAEAALEGALKEREADSEGPELAAALQRIGELSMENELLRAKMGRSPGPLARKRWR